jgi:hypothetical protein
MTHDLNQHHAPTETDPQHHRIKSALSDEDLEDMRAVLEGHKEKGGTPWVEVKAKLDL